MTSFFVLSLLRTLAKVGFFDLTLTDNTTIVRINTTRKLTESMVYQDLDLQDINEELDRLSSFTRLFYVFVLYKVG